MNRIALLFTISIGSILAILSFLKEKNAISVHEISVVSIRNVFDNQDIQVRNDRLSMALCPNCLMITDAEFNAYFTNPYFYPELAEKQISLVESDNGELFLCPGHTVLESPVSNRCAPVSNLSRHKKSTLPDHIG